MKTKTIIQLLIVAVLASFESRLSTAFAQGTAFTYQGRLNDNGGPANGIYDLRFSIFDLSSGGAQHGPTLTNSGAVLSNGLFTVALDFGNQFPGADRWIEIGVVTNGGGAFTTLVPRQLLTSTPYAVRAANFSGTIAAAQLSGTYTGAITFSNISNSFTGNGGGLTGLSAAALSSGIVPSTALSNAWRIVGNAGTVNGTHFVGTTDNQALDFRVFGQRGLRLQPNTNGTPTIIGGSVSNVVSANVPGVTIAGGDRNTIFTSPGLPVEFTSAYAVIGGGSSNYIGMTSGNAVIGGGFQNYISGNDYFSTISGGLQNSILDTSAYSTIGGGQSNTVDVVSPYATIGGGNANLIGQFALYSAIGGGRNNRVQTNAQYSVISGGQDNVIQTNALYSAILGGNNNRIEQNASLAAIGGGGANVIRAYNSVIAGGVGNSIEANAYESMIGGGNGNHIRTNANRSTIGGGSFHQVRADAHNATIGGGHSHVISTNANHSTISGGSLNTIERDAHHAIIGGGQLNTIGPAAQRSTIGGGDGNVVAAISSFVGGGVLNIIETNAFQSVIAGGGNNQVTSNADGASIGGGFQNIIRDGLATIAGGFQNAGTNEGAAIGGGALNTAGFYGTVPGGALNVASGQFSFAAGQRAQSRHDGSFVWGDNSTMATFSSTASNQFLIRATGGVGIGTTAPIYPLHIAAADPVIVLQDTGANATQAGYISYRNGSLTETAWVGFGDPASPEDFFIVNARASGDIILRPLAGNVGISRTPTANKLEVEGNASKTAAGSWLANSDARIKTGVRTVAGALDKLSQVRLVEFHYTDEYRAQHPSLKDRSYLNVVAQEFQKIFPEHVQSSGEKLPSGDEILQVDTYPLTIYSAAAIQELNQKLTQELKRRDAENAELKQRLERLEQLINSKEKTYAAQ